MSEGLSLLQTSFDWAVTAVPGGTAAIWASIIVLVGIGGLYAAFRRFKAK